MGAVVISLDAELAWGYHDKPEAPPRIANAQEGWQAAVALLDTYNIPATWAIVGHLFLSECDGEHADHPLGSDWFSCTPGQRTAADDWRAPHLIDAILESSPNHEIGSHTFSHGLLGDASPAVADAELRLTAEAAQEHGLNIESHVYPRNRVGNQEFLDANGYTCYRGTNPTWYSQHPLRTILKLLDWSPLGSAPPLVEPTIDEHGLVNVPASQYLYSFEGRPRELAAKIGYDPALAVAKRGVDKAAASDGIFHVWLHPHNLLQPGGHERFEKFLAHLDHRRTRTDLEVLTMGEVARETLQQSG